MTRADAESGGSSGALPPDWRPPSPPVRAPLIGARVTLEPLSPGHAASLWSAERDHPRLWDYLPVGPLDAAAHAAWVAAAAESADPLFFAVVPTAFGAPAGVASYLRIAPTMGSIEIGHIRFSPALQRGAAATEALWLMMAEAFRRGYRRLEWKCDALNAPSRRAAQRLGFGFEGVHRQHMVVKGRNRDTAWYALMDHEWPAVDAVIRRWLDPANFDAAGRQRTALSDLTRPLLAAVG